jgi:hypothetical protein
MNVDDAHDDETCTHALPLDLELCLGGGWHAGTAVNRDGTIWPWLLSPEPSADDDDTWHGLPWPEHELLGMLPQAIVEQIFPRHFCGAPAKTTGRPCKAEVHGAGQRCHQHPAAEKTT